MRHSCFHNLILGVLLLATAGCTSYNLTRDGDRYLRSRQPSRALKSYQQAQTLDPSLARNPRFAANLKAANAGACYEQGVKALENNEWESAIASFNKSLDYDRNFIAAHHASLRAQDKGAVELLKQALAQADKGNLSECLIHLIRARKLKPEDADVAEAYRYAADAPLTADNMADRAYLDARKKADEKSWGQAHDMLNQAIRLEPNHVAARVMLYGVKKEIARADNLYEEGSSALDKRNIEQSITLLRQAEEQWPDHPKAASTLQASQAQLTQADEAYKQGKALAAKRDWEGAERQFASALKIYPDHALAKSADADLRKEAAADYFDRGSAALEKGDLDGAWSGFEQSLDHDPNKKESREGLSQVCYVRGRMSEEDELYGKALLWFLEADARYQKEAYLSKIRDMEGKIMERIKFGVAFEVTGPQKKLTQETQTLTTLVKNVLEKEAPQFMELRLNGQGEIVHPSHTAMLTLRSVEVRTLKLGQKQQSHSFTQERNISNPAAARLHAEIGREMSALQQMRAMLNQPCPTCRGRGSVTCNHCGGAGKYKACSTCNGSGRILQQRTGRRITCPECGGNGGLKTCIKCDGRGVINCQTCKGSGLRPGISTMQVRSQESKVARMQRDLAGLPPMVREKTPARYVYVQEEYAKEGRCTIDVELRNLAKGAAPKPEASEAKVVYSDTAIDSARPDIGLEDNPLTLPDDAAVRAQALEEGAVKATRGVMEKAIKQKMEQASLLEREYQRDNNSKEATESALDAALLQNWIDKDAARKKIEALRKQIVSEKK